MATKVHTNCYYHTTLELSIPQLHVDSVIQWNIKHEQKLSDGLIYAK